MSFTQLTEKLARYLTYIAATGLFGLMSLVFVGVIFRYFLNAPLQFRADLMAMMLGVTIFTAIPHVTLSRRHIKIDLLTSQFEKFPLFDRLRRVLIDLGIIAMTVFMSWLLYREAFKAFDRDTTTDTMEWPWWPLFAFYAVLILVSAILFAVRALRERGNAESSARNNKGGISL